MQLDDTVCRAWAQSLCSPGWPQIQDPPASPCIPQPRTSPQTHTEEEMTLGFQEAHEEDLPLREVQFLKPLHLP